MTMIGYVENGWTLDEYRRHSQHIMIKLYDYRWSSKLAIFYLIVRVLRVSGIRWFIRSEIHGVGRLITKRQVVSVFLYQFSFTDLHQFTSIIYINQCVYQSFRIWRFDSCFFQIEIRHFCEAQPRYIDDTSCHGGVGCNVGSWRKLA